MKNVKHPKYSEYQIFGYNLANN